MTLPLQDPNSIFLAARAAKALVQSRQLAFAHIAPDLTVSETSPNLREWMFDPPERVEGVPLTTLFLEFIGAEAALLAVLRGDEPDYQLLQVNRDHPNTTTTYLLFHVLQMESAHPEAGLLLIVENTTPLSQLRQRLIQDRNELRLTQAQLERHSQFKSFVLSMVAHDLSSPLATIQGYAALLQNYLTPNSPPEQREILNVMHLAGQRLNQLMSDLRDLDQIEHGQLAVTFEPCDLNALIQEIYQTVQPAAFARQLAVTLELPESALITSADSKRMGQILHNLMSNAVKYTQTGGAVRVTLRATPEQILIQVADNGPGLTEAQQAQVFNLYYRTDEAQQSPTVGTGLGLFIVKTLVEAHHGRVDVNSQLGHGTTFTVHLPHHPERQPDAERDSAT